ncbi:MAG: hypothetical protein ACFCVK_21350 [Acidimicrobiales bacterium]
MTPAGTTLRHWFPRFFLASIGVNAVLGIWALLTDDFGDTQGKVLATSFLASAAMMGLLANSTPLGRRLLWPVPTVGVVALVAGLALFDAILWFDGGSPTAERLAGTLVTVGVGATLASLLTLITLRREHEWLRLVTDLLVAALTLTIVTIVWVEIDSSWLPRVIGVESVLVAALTIALPTLARFSPPPPASHPGTAVAFFCPACGSLLPSPSPADTPAACAQCGMRFTVEVSVPPTNPPVPAWSGDADGPTAPPSDRP